MQIAATMADRLVNWGIAEPMMNASAQYTITHAAKRYFPGLDVREGARNNSLRML